MPTKREREGGGGGVPVRSVKKEVNGCRGGRHFGLETIVVLLPGDAVMDASLDLLSPTEEANERYLSCWSKWSTALERKKVSKRVVEGKRGRELKYGGNKKRPTWQAPSLRTRHDASATSIDLWLGKSGWSAWPLLQADFLRALSTTCLLARRKKTLEYHRSCFYRFSFLFLHFDFLFSFRLWILRPAFSFLFFVIFVLAAGFTLDTSQCVSYPDVSSAMEGF